MFRKPVKRVELAGRLFHTEIPIEKLRPDLAERIKAIREEGMNQTEKYEMNTAKVVGPFLFLGAGAAIVSSYAIRPAGEYIPSPALVAATDRATQIAVIAGATAAGLATAGIAAKARRNFLVNT
ncbi:MAG TPA: hypothetical protein VJI71_01945, partial [Candidatus Norongarragalinales archaeon]|nr:hypothetical protein [Candidatus Norongarragalinales archaeon]